MKKTIILISPTFTYGLTECIIKNLEYCNFQVINLSDSIPNTIKFNILDKITYKTARLFLGKKVASKIKDKIRFYKYSEKIKNTLSTLHNKRAEYTLCIRPDLYDHKLLEYIKNNSKNFIAYQWDGLNRYPKALEKIKYFDKFYVFDKNDLEKAHGLNYITNFYFDYNLEQLHTHKKRKDKISLYFLGFFSKN
ncbi:hypothetical protein ACI3P4_05415 [Glaesserella parasuis]|uniref:hypothetical protein n=1 Tax=Glaesserella parasuis TaxID=738 RepID=UPI0038523287